MNKYDEWGYTEEEWEARDKQLKEELSAIDKRLARWKRLKTILDVALWVFLIHLVILVALMFSNGANAEGINRERDSKQPVVLLQDYVNQVDFQALDGTANGCLVDTPWTGAEGHLWAILTPADSGVDVRIDFKHYPTLGYPRFSLVDPSQSLSPSEWRAVLLVADDIWRLVDTDGAYSPTTEIGGIFSGWTALEINLFGTLAAHEYTFTETCVNGPSGPAGGLFDG